MSGKQLCTSLLLLLAMAASAAAQDEKNEIGATFGRIFISDQGIQNAAYAESIIRSGKGFTIEGNYAHRFVINPLFSLAGEVLFAYNPDVDLNAGNFLNPVVPTNYSQLFVTPAARLNLFPETAVSPWVSLGGGFAHFSEDKNLDFGGATNPGKNTTSGTLEAGAGLDVKLWRKMSLRGEVRDFWSGEPDFPLAPTGKTRQHNYLVGGGVIWRF